MKLAALRLDNVTKSFTLNREQFLRRKLGRFQAPLTEKIVAVQEVSFSVAEHKIIGLYGPNGSGKSTILKLIAGILVPDSGTITVRGKVATVLELGSGLHPDLTGRENIFLYGTILGISTSHLRRNFSKIVSFSGLARFLDLPIKKYSAGMRARLAFSLVAHSDADILLIDEVFAVGDLDFREKSLKMLKKLKKDHTIVVTSHDIGFLQNFCHQVYLLDQGQILNEQNEALIGLLRQLPAERVFTAQARSNSMAPLIKKGNSLTIRKQNFNSVKAGDIIAFSLANLPEIFVHRVAEILLKGNQRSCLTKGDNVYGYDAWKVGEENYLGKVIKIGRTRV